MAADTPREAVYEDLASLAAQFCGTPVALITFLDAQRLWIKSAVGLPVSEVPFEAALCTHVILEGKVLVVPDASGDPRSASHPLVTMQSGIRFCAGVPLVIREGLALGALCVLDLAPRQLSSEQLQALEVVARQVSTQLELRRRLRELAGTVTERLLTDALQSGSHRIGEQIGCSALHESAEPLSYRRASRRPRGALPDPFRLPCRGLTHSFPTQGSLFRTVFGRLHPPADRQKRFPNI